MKLLIYLLIVCYINICTLIQTETITDEEYNQKQRKNVKQPFFDQNVMVKRSSVVESLDSSKENKTTRDWNNLLSQILCSHSSGFAEDFPWWRVDLEESFYVNEVRIFNRAEGFHESLHDVEVRIGSVDILTTPNNTEKIFSENKLCEKKIGNLLPGENVFRCWEPIKGRFVSVQITEMYSYWYQGNVLSLCEVEVYGSDNKERNEDGEEDRNRLSVQNVALGKPTVQSHKDWEKSSALAVDGILSAQNYVPQIDESCLDRDENYYDTSLFDPPPNDCSEILSQRTLSGVYKIRPNWQDQSDPFEVFCDMTTDGGGWTVIQRRNFYLGSNETFQRRREEFFQFFGNLCQEFWLGTQNLHKLTSQNSDMSLKIEIVDSYGEYSYALYEHFLVENEANFFRIRVNGYSGNAGDFLRSSFPFIEPERQRLGGWWWIRFKLGNITFWGANPNGDLWNGRDVVNPITWGCSKCNKRENYFIHKMEMKIRPFNFVP